MTWFRVDDHLHAHRKSVRAGTEAMGLWVLAGSWSAAEELDGWVPAYMLGRLAGPTAETLALALTEAGLWHLEEVDGEAGYRFHQWQEHQPTREQLDARRADARERMRRARGVRTNTPRSSAAVRITRPDPTRPNNNTAADAADDDPAFVEFWSIYPRKVGRAAAAKAFAKSIGPMVTRATIVEGLRNAIAVWTAAGTDPKFIPHPATWLNQGRWADEVPLPDMPTGETARRRTAAQCDDPDTHPAHDWQWQANLHRCMGV